METVAEEHGWLPSERRDLALTLFAARRATEVRELRDQATARRSELEEAKDRSERAPLRKDTRRLRVPGSDSAIDRQRYVLGMRHPGRLARVQVELSDACPGRGPCQAWPLWQQRVQEVRAILLSSATKKATPPAQPKPQPQAVIPSDLPIEEVITRLSAIQASRPGATVRRGSRNRWEIWPP